MTLVTVWKYKLDHLVETIQMPKGAQVLSVGIQQTFEGPRNVLWAKVNPDPEVEKETRQFVLLPTGEMADQHPALRFDFIGTTRVADSSHVSGEVVSHVFEIAVDGQAL